MTAADRLPGAKPGAKKGSPEHRDRIGSGLRRYHEQRRAAARIAPWEISECARTGTVPEDRRGYAAAAVNVGMSIVADLGGEERLSEQQLLLVRIVERDVLFSQLLSARLVQSEAIDSDLLSKLTSLHNSLRATLQALGLARAERELPTIAELLEQQRARSGDAQTEAPRANGSASDAQPAAAEIVAQERSK